VKLPPENVGAVLPAAASLAHAQTARLFPIVYDRLRDLAGAYLRRQRPDHTLQPTALLHEAFLQLADRSEWKDEAHFLGVAAGVMREILVDHARKRATLKRGGGRRRLQLTSQLFEPANSIDVLAINDALQALRAMNHRQAQVVELRFFGGMTIRQTAVALDISESTVEDDWRFARAWLSTRLSNGGAA
jgi:RNA polymerase sigma factor (TIGR02999 family)